MYKEGITFVIPAYNTELTIARTIESILCQTDPRYEILLINDGSTDHTESICRKYEEEHPDKIRYIYQENRGLGGARNHGIRLADREYISFLDSDDWLMPGYVETIMTQLQEHPDVLPEIILTLPQIYEENSRKVCRWYDYALLEELYPEDGQVIDPQENKKLFLSDVNQCRKILRMDFVDRIHFQFREQVKWEDVYPHFFLLSHCRSCMGIRSTGFYYRKGNPHQITASRGAERMDLLVVYQDLQHYLDDPALPRTTAAKMIFPVMHTMVSFAREGIRMADMDTRRELVQRLSNSFRTIPKHWYQVWKTEGRTYYSKKESVRYRLFLLLLRHRHCKRWFYDYLYQEAAERLVKKIFHRSGKKEEVHGTA